MGRRSDSSSDHRDDPYLSASVAQLLDDLAARTPAPGGGAAAALTCAMAAALVEMATSFASATPVTQPSQPAQGERPRERRARGGGMLGIAVVVLLSAMLA